MKTVFNYSNVSVNRQLEIAILRRLQLVVSNYPFTTSAEITLQKDNANAPNNHICGIWLKFLSSKIFISHSDRSLNSAIAKTIVSLKKRLKKKNTKPF